VAPEEVLVAVHWNVQVKLVEVRMAVPEVLVETVAMELTETQEILFLYLKMDRP
jgi:hypothetical protein